MENHRGPLSTEEFMAWLKDGKGALAVEQANKWAYFIRIPKRPGFDYIFHQEGNQGTQSILNRNVHFVCTGVYMKREEKLYCPNIPVFAIPDWKTDPATLEHSLTNEFSLAVRRSIEEKINNSRMGLPNHLTDDGLQGEVLRYLHNVDEHAREVFVDSVTIEDIRFRSDFRATELNDHLLDYLQDREGYPDRVATSYISLNKEKILAKLMKIDGLREKYTAILSDPANPFHKMKAISEAVKSSGMSTVRVTIAIDGDEKTFHTAARNLKGYRAFYNCTDVPAADRRAFGEEFKQGIFYTAQDVLRITYGKNVLYEAPEQKPAPKMEPAKDITMTMGGM